MNISFLAVQEHDHVPSRPLQYKGNIVSQMSRSRNVGQKLENWQGSSFGFPVLRFIEYPPWQGLTYHIIDIGALKICMSVLFIKLLNLIKFQ